MYGPGGDLAFIVRQFLREKNTLVRGLAHPAIFTDGAFASGEENRKENSMQSMFKKFGAVPVSSGSIYEVRLYGCMYMYVFEVNVLFSI